MQIEKKTTQAEGIKFSVFKEDKEIARASLYMIKNDLHKTPYGLLEDVFVDETQRGHGIATDLVNAIIEEAKKQKCYKLICTSKNSKPKVHELYLKLGFKDIGKEFRMDFE